MGRDAHGDRGSTGGNLIRDAWMLGEYQSQGARPELLGQASSQRGIVDSHLSQLLHSGDVNNQRIGARASFDLEDATNGPRITAMGTQTVNRLRGKDHQFPLMEESGRFLEQKEVRSVGVDLPNPLGHRVVCGTGTIPRETRMCHLLAFLQSPFRYHNHNMLPLRVTLKQIR
jgi:hypothetical protein